MAKAELIKARELIESGWAQGTMKTDHSCYCLDGAIGQAHNALDESGWPNFSSIEDNDACMADIRYLIGFLPDSAEKRHYENVKSLNLGTKKHKHSEKIAATTTVYAYNDESGTTKEDVLAVLDKAIAASE